MHRWLRRTVVVVGIVSGVVFVPGVARADTVAVDPAALPVTAAGFVRDPVVEDPCPTIRSTAPSPDRQETDDIWVFAARGTLSDAGIERLTATFGDGTVTVDGGGRSLVWVATAQGRTLIGAEATVRGEAQRLELAAACPATVATTVTPSPTPTAQAAGRARPAPAKAAPARPELAQTGADVGGMVTLGVSLVVAGALLLIVRRTKPPRPIHEPDDDRGTTIVITRT